jgi:malate synthase
LKIRGNLKHQYSDIYTPAALGALQALASLDGERKALMDARIARRAERARTGTRIDFLALDDRIPRTSITVRDARAAKFEGTEIPRDLQRQWIQGTGPAAKPNAPVDKSIRNVAYALLSGADGWMFDGEDALGQVTSMSLDNQRNLKLAYHRDPVFLAAAEQVAEEMNAWAGDFLGDDGSGFSASIADVSLYIVNNQERMRGVGSSLVLYLPKIQTAAEAALWNEILTSLELHLGVATGTIKTYVLVEQIEACFQLMEIRAALHTRFVGFNTGRWDYINSVSDALAWDSGFVNPNIDAITMTYGYMRNYEDRVRRAVNTPDALGRTVLWQGGMEPNIPVGSPAGVAAGMARAVAGAEREQREGASGKWVAHWKMVHIVRPVWEKQGQENQLGRQFPALTYTEADAADLRALEPSPRTVRGARDLISVALQYGNAFGQGLQAAALKPADFFGNDDVLYLMEDMATGEIRLSIVWEWLHKDAAFSADDESGVKTGDTLTPELFSTLLAEEYEKLLKASNRDVHEVSKTTTLPIAREIVETYVASDRKLPWYIDLLNVNLNNVDLMEAKRRIRLLTEAFKKNGERLTGNLDF